MGKFTLTIIRTYVRLNFLKYVPSLSTFTVMPYPESIRNENINLLINENVGGDYLDDACKQSK